MHDVQEPRLLFEVDEMKIIQEYEHAALGFPRHVENGPCNCGGFASDRILSG